MRTKAPSWQNNRNRYCRHRGWSVSDGTPTHATTLRGAGISEVLNGGATTTHDEDWDGYEVSEEQMAVVCYPLMIYSSPCCKLTERKGAKETETDGQTGRETDRQADREEIGRQTCRQTTLKDTGEDRQTGRQTRDIIRCNTTLGTHC